MEEFKYESQNDRIVRELLEANNQEQELTEFVQSIYQYCKDYKENNKYGSHISKFIIFCNPRQEKYMREQFHIPKEVEYVKQIGDVKLEFYSCSTNIKDIDIDLLFSNLIEKGNLKIIPIMSDNDYLTAYPIFARGGQK